MMVMSGWIRQAERLAGRAGQGRAGQGRLARQGSPDVGESVSCSALLCLGAKNSSLREDGGPGYHGSWSASLRFGTEGGFHSSCWTCVSSCLVRLFV